MKFRMSVVLSTIVGLTLLAVAASANDDAKSQKGEKKKRAEGEKVEMKDVPTAVTDAAKKELPNATFATAEKVSAKKLGTIYTLEGKDGKYQVSVMYTSSGDLQRLMKTVESRKKKTK